MVSLTDIDECQGTFETTPCDHNAVCINQIGAYKCMCLTGYAGDGFSCTREYIYYALLRGIMIETFESNCYIMLIFAITSMCCSISWLRACLHMYPSGNP